MRAPELTVCLNPAFELSPPVAASEAKAAAVAGWSDNWRANELSLVKLASQSARSPAARFLAIAVSWLGNGWIYPMLLALLVLRFGAASGRIVLPALVNCVLLHAIYPVLKRIFRRERPFRADPRLPILLAVLDKHSFPSGHTMTLVGVLTPIVILWPASFLAALAFALCMGWSRVATAHHYPSDVAAGAALGLGLGYPATVWLLPWLG